MKRIQAELLSFLDNNGWDIFSLEMLKSKSNLAPNQINEALRRLIQSKLIIRLERGKYCRHNFSNEYVIGSFLVKNGGIAYWTAIDYHGLTEQIPNIVYVQTTQAKKNKSIFGVRYKFIQVKKEKLVGFKTMGYGNHRFKITDIEKTIIDSFDIPKYSGGYNEIIKAFNKANLNARKLVKYSRAIDNIAAVKRMAYLCELLNKPKMDYFIQYALSIKNEKYNLFENDGDNQGLTIKRWNLILNMDKSEILEIANS